jgi:hypothetical protein
LPESRTGLFEFGIAQETRKLLRSTWCCSQHPQTLSPKCQLMLSVALSVFQVRAVSDDRFWDEQFGVPGVPYEEGVVSAMMAVGKDLYVGGTFTRIGGLATTSIARWDGTNWHPLGSGIDGGVFELVQSRRELTAAGHFLTAGGAPARYVARWNGEEWSEVGGGVNGTVFALSTDGSDVYVGGHFTEAGGVPAGKVASWDGGEGRRQDGQQNRAGQSVQGFHRVRVYSPRAIVLPTQKPCAVHSRVAGESQCGPPSPSRLQCAPPLTLYPTSFRQTHRQHVNAPPKQGDRFKVRGMHEPWVENRRKNTCRSLPVSPKQPFTMQREWQRARRPRKPPCHPGPRRLSLGPKPCTSCSS